MGQEAFNVTLYLLEKMVGGFKKGAVYAVASRPLLGKTDFCIRTSLIYAQQHYKVLYLSDDLTKSEFKERLFACDKEPFVENIQFAPAYCLGERRLLKLLDENPCDILVIDSFDVLSVDVDIGRLKEIAIEHDCIVWLSKQLSRPRWIRKQRPPVLSDLHFPQAKAQRKFIAYCDAIFFLYYDGKTHSQRIYLGKNRNGRLIDTEG